MSYSIDDVARLTTCLIDAEDLIKEQELILAITKERLRRLKEETLPGVMQEIGLSELKLDTGDKLTIKSDVYSQLPADGKAPMYRWLENNGFGGLIKTNLNIEFAKGEVEKAKRLAEILIGKGLPAQVGRSIHAQTLGAFLREQLANGNDIPMDTFGARVVFIAKVTRSRKSK